jgi:SAM-dependent methyltransferase
VPGLEENRRIWTQVFDWSAEGDDWSAWWGGTRAMWFGALLPRIHAFVPTGTILEIAPGYGRWTQHLAGWCDRLIGVDLVEGCVDHCRRRFSADPRLEFHVNDGTSLDMVEDGSVDLAFSFDSLVHAEAEVISTYLEQLRRKLAPDGVGFFHHSNLAAHRQATRLARRVPGRWAPSLMEHGVLVDLRPWRSETQSGALFIQQCEDAGLSCIGQERISWSSGPHLLDALSLFTSKGSAWDRPLQVVRNPLFGQEAHRMRELYASAEQPRRP